MNAPKWPEKWADKTWKVSDGTLTRYLTEEKLRAFYAAVPQGKAAMCKVLDVAGLQNRLADRALKLLREEKLIWFNPDTKLWEQSGPACPEHGTMMVVGTAGQLFCTACSAEDD